jgi:hypothetical protein
MGRSSITKIDGGPGLGQIAAFIVFGDIFANTELVICVYCNSTNIRM